MKIDAATEGRQIKSNQSANLKKPLKILSTKVYLLKVTKIHNEETAT